MLPGLRNVVFRREKKVKNIFLSVQGGLIYEAKVQALQKEDGVIQYCIHYKVNLLMIFKAQLICKSSIRGGIKRGTNVFLSRGY